MCGVLRREATSKPDRQPTESLPREAIFLWEQKMTTQIEYARSGQITDPMRTVAEKEGLSAELVREQIASGRLVIPANRIHLAGNLVPTGIGRAASTKINANI